MAVKKDGPSQADLVAAWLGTVGLLLEGEPMLPLDVAGQAATMVVSRMSWDQPWTSLTRPREDTVQCPECGERVRGGAIHVCPRSPF
jgi:hypothetical protein